MVWLKTEQPTSEWGKANAMKISFPPHPNILSFDEVECCAMALIYETLSPEPGGPIDRVLRQFSDTLSLGFTPSGHLGELVKELYPELATYEEARLVELGLESELPCGHSAEEHIGALRAVRAKFPAPSVN